MSKHVKKQKILNKQKNSSKRMIIESILVLAGLGLAFGIFLGFASKKFEIKRDPKIDEILKLLSGANCGACGYAGCQGYAEALVSNKDVPVNLCVPGQKAVADKIAEIMGKGTSEEKAEIKSKKVSQLYCNGNNDNCHVKSSREVKSCKEAHSVKGGYKNCSYACFGTGDCSKACPVKAISMHHGLPKVDKEKCIGCGVCVKTCPQHLYELVDADKKVHVLCSSKYIAKDVLQKCKVGCIACKACEKACKLDAIHVSDNLARIDYPKCTQCGACVKVCPRKSIVDERR